ncbi:hypothetical protein H5410_000822 [Solanum commersonii]|uniref:Uncharacterized protein n=1 Tax=Solanum commersonii TaxID=4109 RepID=A0A9J6AXJ5_SOLCO|nr:hypothetical protein H5410_000822 [Solanum commersonii]
MWVWIERNNITFVKKSKTEENVAKEITYVTIARAPSSALDSHGSKLMSKYNINKRYMLVGTGTTMLFTTTRSQLVRHQVLTTARISTPGLVCFNIRTRFRSAEATEIDSVSSTCTTASAPSGTGPG